MKPKSLKLFILFTAFSFFASVSIYLAIDFQRFLVNRRIEVSENVTIPVSSLSSMAEHYFHRNIIFIVGAQSSGTTLMRLLLDTHPEVNCGDETAIVHLIQSYLNNNIFGKKSLVRFMSDFGVSNQTVTKAVALFIYYIIENNKKHPEIVDTSKFRYICNKGNTFRTYILNRI